MLGRVGLMVAAVNLLPVSPFRGRLLLLSLLRPQVGNRSAVSITRRVGIIVAVLLFTVGVVTSYLPLVLISAMCGASIQRRSRLDRVAVAVEETGLSEGPPQGLKPVSLEQLSENPRFTEDLMCPPEIEPEPREPDDHDLDRILRKITERGIESLDAQEKAYLDKATRRRRDDP